MKLFTAYSNMLFFFFVVVFVTLVLIILTALLVSHRFTLRKTSSYECGFEPFSGTSHPCNMNFFNVALLFLLFDVELFLLMPGVGCLLSLPLIGRVWLLVFINILMLGYIYEYKKKLVVVNKKN